MFANEPEVIIKYLRALVKGKNLTVGIAFWNDRIYNEGEVMSMYAERIRALRLRAGMSQQELGASLGVSAVAVGKWERGQTQPDIHSLTRMADIFGTTIDDLCDHAPRCQEEEPNIRIMTRAFRQLTAEEQEKFLAVGRALFGHAFSEKEEQP